MRLLLALTAAAMIAAPLAAAAKVADAPAVAVAYGNTVISTYPDGRKGRLWIHKGGTYDAAGRRNTPSSGTWAIKEDKICLKQRRPIPAPFTYCTATPTGGIGTSWKAKAVTGEPITVSVVRGVVRAPEKTASR